MPVKTYSKKDLQAFLTNQTFKGATGQEAIERVIGQCISVMLDNEKLKSQVEPTVI